MRVIHRLGHRSRIAALVATLLGITVGPATAQSETIEYYGLDALGSVRVIFNAQGAVVDRMDYGPFGENLRAAIKFPVEQFAQLARDAESGQDYAQARNYSGSTGRFNRVDPVYAGLFEPQKWNRYAYALNRPATLVDPDGLDPITTAVCGLGFCSTFLVNVAAKKTPAPFNSLSMRLDSRAADAWLDALWIGTQLGDIFTGTIPTGSTVPGEDEIIPTKRDTPSDPAQVIAAAAGVASLAVPGGGKSSASRILGRTPRAMQKGFDKHGPDFGLTGRWNPSRAGDFSAAVHRHVNDVNTREIIGKYKNQPAIHFVNPQTGLNVIAHPNGNYWSAFQLSSNQLHDVLTNGWLW